MKKEGKFSFLLILFSLVLVLPSFVSSFSGVGGGTSINPFIVTNCTQLSELRSNVSANYKLGNNINMFSNGCASFQTGLGFDPIGNNSVKFSGVLNGSNYNISNLYINRSTQDNVGLFGALNTGNISNLGILNATIYGKDGVGGLVGLFEGKIFYSFVTGNITGSGSVGGLAGWDNDNSPYFREYIISNSHFIGEVFGSSNVGGLVGSIWGNSIRYSYALANISNTGDYTGGISGYSGEDVRLDESYFSGIVRGNNFVGGITGYNYVGGYYYNIYSLGTIIGVNNVGGLFGGISDTEVHNSYTVTNVSGTGSDVGGLVGLMIGNAFYDCYYTNQTSDSIFTPEGTPKTITQMKNISTFSGWNITSVSSGQKNTSAIWNILNGESYPFLSWQFDEPLVYNLTNCRQINRPGTYTILNNISTIGTCFNITSSDVILDLAGFSITGDSSGIDYGIFALSRNNITIKNGQIQWFRGATGNSRGIYFINVNNSLIQNITSSNNGRGIFLSNSFNNHLVDINTYSNAGHGVYMEYSSLNIINNLSTYSNLEQGVELSYSSSNFFYNTTSYLNSGHGIFFAYSNLNQFVNLTAYLNSQNGVRSAFYSSNNSFIDITTFSNSFSGFQLDSFSLNNTIKGLSSYLNINYGMYFSDTSSNFLINIDSHDNTLNEFYNYNLGNNFLIYNNTYGQILWLKNNLTTEGELTFPGNISISNNSVSFNSANMTTTLNSSANVTLRGLLTNYISPKIYRDNIYECNSTTIPACYNFTSLNAGEVIFNVSSWSNYSIQEEPDISAPIINNLTVSVTTSTATISWNISEQANYTTYYGTTLALTNNVSNSSYLFNFTKTLSSLSSNTKYYYNLTICDFSNNCNTTNSSFTTQAEANDDEDSSGSSGGGAELNRVYIAYRNQTNSTLGYNKNILSKDKIIFYLDNKNHTLTLTSIINKNASFSVQSVIQYFNLSSGQEKKLNLTSLNYFDFSIKVNSIVGNRVNLTLKEIYEPINTIKYEDKIEDNSSTSSLGQIGENILNNLAIGSLKPYIFWSIILILLVALIYLISFILHKHRKRKYYLYGYY